MKWKLIHSRPSISGYSFCIRFDYAWSIALSQDHHNPIFASTKLKNQQNKVEIEGTATLRRKTSLLVLVFGYMHLLQWVFFTQCTFWDIYLPVTWKSRISNLAKHGLNKMLKGEISNSPTYIISRFHHLGMGFTMQMMWYLERIKSMVSQVLATNLCWLVKIHLSPSWITRTDVVFVKTHSSCFLMTSIQQWRSTFLYILSQLLAASNSSVFFWFRRCERQLWKTLLLFHTNQPCKR